MFGDGYEVVLPIVIVIGEVAFLIECYDLSGSVIVRPLLKCSIRVC